MSRGGIGPGFHGIESTGDGAALLPVTMKGRPNEGRPEDTPGPGAYDVAVGGSSPGVTLKGRHPERLGDGGPGPGAYDLPSGAGGGFTIAGRYPDGVRDGGPGPGAYDIRLPERSGPRAAACWMLGCTKHLPTFLVPALPYATEWCCSSSSAPSAASNSGD